MLARRTQLKRRTPIRRVSAKKRAAIADRSALLRRLRAERGDVCEVRLSPACRRRADGLHEPLKQSASRWKPGDYDRGRVVYLCCNPCNGWIEDHPAATPPAFRQSRHGGIR